MYYDLLSFNFWQNKTPHLLRNVFVLEKHIFFIRIATYLLYIYIMHIVFMKCDSLAPPYRCDKSNCHLREKHTKNVFFLKQWSKLGLGINTKYYSVILLLLCNLYYEYCLYYKYYSVLCNDLMCLLFRYICNNSIGRLRILGR